MGLSDSILLMRCMPISMRKIDRTNAYKRDFKRESKGQNRDVLDGDLKDVIKNLSNDIPLAVKYRDHPILGNWNSYRNCHVRPDLVLIYRLVNGDGTDENPSLLILVRLGSHSKLNLC